MRVVWKAAGTDDWMADCSADLRVASMDTYSVAVWVDWLDPSSVEKSAERRESQWADDSAYL